MNVDQRVPRFIKNQKKNNNSKGKQKQKQKQNGKTSLKVVYISSPMKVKTSASRFRSLVQELTGKNSDVSQYMDGMQLNNRDIHDFDYDDEKTISSISPDDTPTSSDSFLGGPIDNVYISQTDQQFAEIFSFDIDVLGNYDELL